jgi:hypothetical protein
LHACHQKKLTAYCFPFSYEDAFNRFIDEINLVAAYEWWEDLYTVYFLFLHILVPGLGSNGAEEKRYIVFKSMLNLNTTIHVFVLAGHGLSIKA